MAFKYDSTHNADSGKQPGDPVGFNSKMGWGNVFERSFATPLDRTELFMSYADALAYATGGSDARGLSGTSYPGQIVTVLTNGSPVVYAIAGGHIYTSEDVPEGASVGDEDVSTRTLVQLGTKQEIESASASAVMNWLNASGQEI